MNRILCKDNILSNPKKGALSLVSTPFHIKFPNLLICQNCSKVIKIANKEIFFDFFLLPKHYLSTRTKINIKIKLKKKKGKRKRKKDRDIV
jgi:hypothetical protein